jgi:hypothetical protein
MYALRAGARPPSMLVHLFMLGAACALVVGCTGDGERGSSASAAFAADGSGVGSPSLARSTTGAPRDACELIPAERIATIVGGPVRTSADPGPQESSCAYTDESGQFPYLELTVYWTGGKQMLDIVQMGTALAAGMMAEPGDEALVDSIVRPGPVAALGDTAFFSDIMPSYVLTGDVLLEMMMPLLPDARQHFRPLASSALAKL